MGLGAEVSTAPAAAAPGDGDVVPMKGPVVQGVAVLVGGGPDCDCACCGLEGHSASVQMTMTPSTAPPICTRWPITVLRLGEWRSRRMPTKLDEGRKRRTTRPVTALA